MVPQEVAAASMNKRLLEDFAEIASDWFWEMDRDLRFTYFSARLGVVAGVDPDREIGKSRVEIAANAADPAFWRPHLDDLLSRRPFRDFVYPYRHGDGQVRWFRISGQPVVSGDGAFQGYRGVGTDITAERQARHDLALALDELKAANARLAVQNQALHDANARLEAEVARRERLEGELRRLVSTDGLTGLASRAVLRERIEDALGRLDHREGGLALLCLDLDRFKAVNDTLGHPVGDSLLQRVAGRLRACAGERATVARLGGDEFAILLTAGGAAGAEALAATLVREVGRPYRIGRRRLEVGVSIGIGLAPQHGSDVDHLLTNADIALYRAKAEGRGAHRLFEPAMERRATAEPTTARPERRRPRARATDPLP